MIKISKHRSDIDFYLQLDNALFKHIRYWINDNGNAINHYSDFTYGLLL